MINLKNIYLAFALVSIVGLSSCSSSQTLTTKVVKNGAVVIDGEDQEWKDAYVSFEEGKTSVASRFDDDFLYLSIKTKDTNLIKKIFGLGLNVKMTNENNSSESFIIKYPVAGLANLSQFKNFRPGSMPDEEALKKDAFFRENVIDFAPNAKSKKTNRYTLANFQKQNQIFVKIKHDPKEFIYEIAAPRQSGFMNLSILNTKPVVKVKIETNELTGGFGEEGGEGGPPPGPPPGGFPGSTGVVKEMFTPFELNLTITPEETISSVK